MDRNRGQLNGVAAQGSDMLVLFKDGIPDEIPGPTEHQEQTTAVLLDAQGKTHAVYDSDFSSAPASGIS